MPQSNSNATVVNLFKEVYGDLSDLLPEDYLLAKDIKFNEKAKVGEKYVEAVVLTNEAGISLLGSAAEVSEINPAIAGAVKQTEVVPYVSVLGSVVPWASISRSVGEGAKSFFSATKHIVRNNLKSHSKFMEILRFYGQSAEMLGTVSYATATYRGVALTNGTGTINGVAYTNGINAADKKLLFSPGQFASGIWVGLEGVVVQQLNSSNVVVAEGNLVSVDSEYGSIEVDFTPIAATSIGSHKLCFKGMADAKEVIGANKILNNATTSLFGISTSSYALWKGNNVTLVDEKLKLSNLQSAVAAAVNRGGLEGDLDCYVNPRSWATLVTTESGARDYDSSYKKSEAENGFESIKFYAQNGSLTIKAHRIVKEGEAYCMSLSDWKRSGSSEVSFEIPGMNQEVIFPLSNQTGYAFRSYSDQYLFCDAPAKSILIDGINDESSS